MTWSSAPPLVLDFDRSVHGLGPDEVRLDLEDWQEALRFSCSWADFERFEAKHPLPPDHGCLFAGSGDYHHLSLLPLKRLAASKSPLEVVVCDNHPDNMRYPFGLHCGSWVRWASALPGVSHIHVLGISSSDVNWSHAWENNLRPLMSGRLTYWCIGREAAWLRLLGRPEGCRSFAAADDLMEAFLKTAEGLSRVYLSIDKDVFSPETVRTNWDQGCWEKRHLGELINALAGRLAGADVTGEVSAHNYRGLFKKVLTRLDRLEKPEPSRIKEWQAGHLELNLEILSMLKKAGH